MKEAENISPDPNDTTYLGLALKFGCPIWSQDKKLKEQQKVEILGTEEVLKKIG